MLTIKISYQLFGTEVDSRQLESDLPPVPPLCDHKTCDGCWKGYPQSRFPNWTYRQVVKSKIQKALTEYSTEQPCVCHRVDVDVNGFFTNAGAIVANHGDERATWERVISETVRKRGVLWTVCTKISSSIRGQPISGYGRFSLRTCQDLSSKCLEQSEYCCARFASEF